MLVVPDGDGDVDAKTDLRRGGRTRVSMPIRTFCPHPVLPPFPGIMQARHTRRHVLKREGDGLKKYSIYPIVSCLVFGSPLVDPSHVARILERRFTRNCLRYCGR